MSTELIDTLLKRVTARGGCGLRLESGLPIRMKGAAGEMSNVTARVLTRQEIMGTIAAIVPDEAKQRLPLESAVEFDYTTVDLGMFKVTIRSDGDQLLVAIDASAGEDSHSAPAPANQKMPSPAASVVPPAPIPSSPAAPPAAAASSTVAVPAVVTAAPGPGFVEGGVRAIDRLFRAMFDIRASDLHLCVGMPPLIRNDGEIQPLEANMPALDPESIVALLDPIIPQKNREEFERRHDTDFAYEISGLARFRANVFMDRKGRGAVFRVIPSKILTAEELGLSPHILQLCRLSKGLVLVTGPTGSGKSTTLCAMVDYINRNRTDHIITIEDPIEFVHDNKRCLMNQREVHTHTDSFKDALRAALREDPDIILVGELRDLETVAIAIETAETGHLVFGTLHTTTAPSTVDRVIDQFPPDRQAQIRIMLSESLRGVIAQTLCKKIGGGRIAALEVLIITPAVSNLIREGKTFQLPSMMQVGKKDGMVSLNDALFELVTKKLVAPDEAYVKAVEKNGFEALLKRAGIDTKFVMGGPAA
jgi:twitching motility protein PilT